MPRPTTASKRGAITTIDRAPLSPAVAGPTRAPGPIELMLDSLETALAHLHAIDDGAMPTEAERARAEDLWARLDELGEDLVAVSMLSGWWAEGAAGGPPARRR